MKNPLLWIIISIVVVSGILWWKKQEPVVNSFEDCVKAGNPILESDPPVCIHRGKSFTKESLKDQQINTKQDMKQYPNPPPLTIDKNKTYVASLDTSKGKIRIELFPKETPATVNNFIFLAKDGFYDGSPFHRIIKGFMIQGGDPTGTGTGSPGYKFADEPITREYKRGIVAMANSGPNTNGSQFFIMHADYALPKNYVIFGQVTDDESLKTVDAIANTPVAANEFGESSKPQEIIVIKGIKIEEK